MINTPLDSKLTTKMPLNNSPFFKESIEHSKTPPPLPGFLLQENGDFLLQENGDRILLES